MPILWIRVATALAIVQNNEGFGLAADGLDYDVGTGRPRSDCAQKIFPVELQNSALACCLCGITTFWGVRDPGERDLLFDFGAELPRALALMMELATLEHFADVLGGKLCRKLRKAIAPIRAPKASRTDVMLAGYYRRRPAFVSLLITTTVVPGEIKSSVHEGELLDDAVNGCFPKAILAGLNKANADPAFEKYQLRGPDAYHGVQMATERAHRAVFACYDPEVIAYAPDECRTIGGHIHVAQITPDAGFNWVIPPKCGA